MGDDAYRAYLAGGGAPTIYDPGKDTPERRMQQCDSCHNFFSESSITFVPGPSGYPHDPLQAPIGPRTPGSEKQFYADGHDMSPCTVGRVLRASTMGKKGVECRDCHDAHGNAHWAELRLPTADNSLCLRCHAPDPSGAFADAAAVARHAHHRADGPGILCVECHMPRDMRFSDGIHIMSTQIHSHAMSIPTGREGERGGPAPACNLCHADRDAAWSRRTIESWRGAKPPR
jgi:predicted CXXCH cytochrome family protein